MTQTRSRYLRLGGVLALLLIALWFATQHAALRLGYQPALGEPFLHVLGYRLYAPWNCLVWQSRFGDTVPGAFTHTLNYILGGVGVIGLTSLWSNHGKRDVQIHGSAAWATEGEIKAASLLNRHGVFLGQMPDGRYLRHDGPQHISVIAPTRSGKGAGIVVPTLLTWPHSTIVYDLKQENFDITSGKRSEFSRILYFQPNADNSCHFNPLWEVRHGDNEVRDVQNIADMIVDPDGRGLNDHWAKTGHSLLVGAILHILYSAADDQKNLAGVAAFLSDPNRDLRATLEEMLHFPHLDDGAGGRKSHPVVAAAARDMLNKSENERSGVLSTAMSFLTLYRDPMVKQNTMDSDFTIDELVDGELPSSLYLVIPPSDINRLRPLIRLVLNQVCRRLTERLEIGGRRHKLLLLLDEFPALGRLEFFESALGFMAGYGLRAMLISQSMNQLTKTYGDKNSILDNCHVRVFYAPNRPETADWISKAIGTTTIKYETDSESAKPLSAFISSRSKSRHYSARALMTPDEVMRKLGDDESLIFTGGSPPVRARKIRYYADLNFKERVLTPPEMTIETYDGPHRQNGPWSNVGLRGVVEMLVHDEASSGDVAGVDSSEEYHHMETYCESQETEIV